MFDKWESEDTVLKNLETAVESRWIDGDEDYRRSLIAILSDLKTSYGRLYLCRLNYYGNQKISQDVWNEIENHDLSEAATYYAEFIFALVRHRKPVSNKLSEIRDAKISTFALLLSKLYDDSGDSFLKYIKDDNYWSGGLLADSHRIKANLAYGFLLNGKLDESLYHEFFQVYLDSGISFLEANYQIDVLDNARIAWTRTDADAFLLYMRLAQSAEMDSVEYVRYLRLALKQDKDMKKGINFLLEKVKESLSRPKKDEINELKLSAQNAIKENINTGELDLAVTLINEYERVFGLDAPLYAAKGIIRLIDGQVTEAASAFLEGLKLEPNDSDLLYNLGYLAEEQGRDREAFDYYSRALENVQDEEFEVELNESIQRVKPL
ncbi:MAG: tetratricopeptide repeat protein [Bacteroidales bacterium]|nr:tetratricopeptide repeat protein [Bacteroidales bacterium]